MPPATVAAGINGLAASLRPASPGYRGCMPRVRSASRTSRSSGMRSSRSMSPPGLIPGPGDHAARGAEAPERDFGRRERERWGPRELDLDLLVFGRARLSLDRPPAGLSLDPGKAGRLLSLPHPEAAGACSCWPRSRSRPGRSAGLGSAVGRLRRWRESIEGRMRCDRSRRGTGSDDAGSSGIRVARSGRAVTDAEPQPRRSLGFRDVSSTPLRERSTRNALDSGMAATTSASWPPVKNSPTPSSAA